MLLQSITLIVCLGSVPFQSPPILKDGDMVALVGGTLIEREQISGYWETELTRRITGQKVRFCNLGWSGGDKQKSDSFSINNWTFYLELGTWILA